MPAPSPIYSVSSDQVALVAATTKTVFELATPAGTTATPVMWWVEFDGVTASNTPVKVEWGIFSAGVTTATTVTPQSISGGGRAIASQCTTKFNTSAEGAGTATISEFHRVPPTSGLYIQEPLGMEWNVGASSFFRIRCTAAQAVNITFGIRWAE